MNTQLLYSFVATVLADTHAFEHWKNNPELIRQQGIDPDMIDWAGLRGFNALSTKVRHNQLRTEIPLTFRLLKGAELELEFFADYAHEAVVLKKIGKTSINDKLLSFCRFIEDWLDIGKPVQRLIWDIVRHETTLYQYRESTTANGGFKMWPARVAARSVPFSVAATCIDAHTVPSINGSLTIQDYQFDPIQVQSVCRVSIDMDSFIQQSISIGYWLKDKQSKVKILHLNELCRYVLQVINDKDTISSVGQGLRCKDIEIDNSALISVFEAMAAHGLVSFSLQESR